jgi:hypothetical protein
MLINRRTYTLFPSHFRQSVELAKRIREATRTKMNRSFDILTAIYGPYGTIVLELPFTDDPDHKQFSDVWYPMLYEHDWVAEWFSHVHSTESHLLFVRDLDGQPAEDVHTAPRPGMLIHRHRFSQIPSHKNDLLAVCDRIRAETRMQFDKDFRLLREFYGDMGVTVMEFCFASQDEQKEFLDGWYPMMEEKGWMTELFSYVSHGTGELWQSLA